MEAELGGKLREEVDSGGWTAGRDLGGGNGKTVVELWSGTCTVWEKESFVSVQGAKYVSVV